MAKIIFQQNAGPVVVVSDQNAADLEATWKYLHENAGQEAVAEFADEKERNAFARQARAWANSHDPMLKFRALPQGDLPATLMRFRITLNVTKEENREETRPAA